MRRIGLVMGAAMGLGAIIVLGNLALAAYLRIDRSELGIRPDLAEEGCIRPEIASLWRMYDGFPNYNGELVAHQFGVYAAYAYNAYSPEPKKSFDLKPELFGWSRRGDPLDRFGGFHADVYHRNDGRRLSVMVVFRGTDGPADLPDLISNASYFTQMVNPWDQYRTARRVFMDVRGDARALSGGLPIEYLAVGHSLGGGLARHMAAAFPCTVAITFNSSFVSNNFRLSDPFINRLKPNLEKRGRIIDIFEERDPLSRVALYQSPHDFFRINDQHQWYRAYNVSDDNGQHGILAAAQAMARIPADCLRRDDCVLHGTAYGGKSEVRKLYCIASPISQGVKREFCPESHSTDIR